MGDVLATPSGARVWRVGALCRAVADALDARFNPVTVSGEISGFSRATSGHCYFVLKDETGQLRCAMFRRAASLLNFSPKDGERVEVRGRLGVYEPRGELQLVVESMSRAGQGTLFEQFLILKEKLDREGLFDPQRKRPLTAMPRAIGVVTSLGAAALHDVVTALQRRVPHIPVVLAPASVQGEGAPRELVKALESLFTLARDEGSRSPVDTILLVRGGGSMEDLWAFNDEALARVIARSPVPLVCGVGHETDFTIADFVADLRAPTPTAAAELVAMPTQVWLDEVQRLDGRLQEALTRRTDREAQRLDQVTARMGRPSQLAHRSRMHLASLEQGLSHAMQIRLRTCRSTLESMGGAVPRTMQRTLEIEREQLARAALRLGALDPSLVLRRGYAWLADGKNRPITSITQTQVGQQVVATLADGAVDMTVQHRHAN
ncbi:MAG TPA: exodeoxyribonuclease VII large subunit [Rhodoferax sp.]|nr:exodeoxyribonuclease VII large subunit [Rhodoferax sp.]